MPSKLSVFFLCAITSVSSVRRAGKNTDESLDRESAQGDPKKCTISWMSKGVATTVSFAVKSCINGCNVNSDNKYYRKFAPFFDMEEAGKRHCLCKQRDNEKRIAFKLVGKCPKDGGESCFDRYTDIRTESYKALGESSVTRVKSLQDKHERTFNYVCDDSNWNIGDATSFQLPTILDGRDQEELDAVHRVVKKFGSKGRIGLTPDEADLLDAIKESDDLKEVVGKIEGDAPESNPDDGTIGQKIIYQDIADGGDMTVGKLRKKYEDLLKDTGLSLPHLINVGGLGDKADDDVVTQEMFKKFVEPDCEK